MSVPLHDCLFVLTRESSSAPLLPNIVPHLQTLVNFVTHTLPKPVLIALLYRLSILHFASHILPTIGADSWESEEGVDDGWDGRPVSARFLFLRCCDRFTNEWMLDVDIDSVTLHLSTVDIRNGVLPSPT